MARLINDIDTAQVKRIFDILHSDTTLFKGLRRKTIKKSDDRYFSLIVNLDLKQPLKDALEQTGCSQRQFVEAAIETAIASVTPVVGHS